MSEEFRWETNAEAKVKLEIPIAWHQDRPEPNVLVLRSPDDQVTVELVFVVGPNAGVHIDDKLVMTTLHDKLQDVKVMNPPSNFQQHGLFGFSIGGGGKHADGRVMQFFSIALGDGKGHGLISFGLAAHRGFVTHGEAISRITGSVQPA